MSEVKPAPVTLPRRLLAEPRRHHRPDLHRHLRRDRPGSVPLYIAQIIGAAIGLGLVIALFLRHTTIPEPKVVARPPVPSTVRAIQES